MNDGNAYAVEANDGRISMTFAAGEGKLFELSYSEDLAKEAGEKVDEMIEALGTITLDSEEAVEAAREAYDSLNEDAKAYVTKLDVLEAAEKKLEELKQQENAGGGTDSSDKDDESDQGTADDDAESNDQGNQSEQAASPSTGDNSGVGGYLALLAASAAGIIALILERKRRAGKF